MLANLRDFVKAKHKDILLAIIMILLILLSFALGYITAKYQPAGTIQFENDK